MFNALVLLKMMVEVENNQPIYINELKKFPGKTLLSSQNNILMVFYKGIAYL